MLSFSAQVCRVVSNDLSSLRQACSGSRTAPGTTGLSAHWGGLKNACPCLPRQWRHRSGLV